MIDPDIIIISIGILAIAIGDVHTLIAAEPAIARHVQAIAEAWGRREDLGRPASREIIGQRHAAD